VSHADVRAFGTQFVARELSAAAWVHHTQVVASKPSLQHSPHAHDPPSFPSSPLVDGETLDPTLLKKKPKDNGEADTLSADQDSDEDKEPPPLLNHDQLSDHDDPDGSDSDNPDDLDSARPTTADCDTNPEMPPLVDLPRPSCVSPPWRRR
jgi:hypothetical protein